MSLVKTTKNGNGNNGNTLPSIFSDFFDTDRFFNDDLFPAFRRFPSLSVPAANITENGKSFKIEMAIPGMDKKDIKVAVEDNIITISAEKETETDRKEDDEKYTRHEFSYNSFSRSFQLPQTVKADQIEAKCENGVLKLTLPKKEEAISKAKKEIRIS